MFVWKKVVRLSGSALEERVVLCLKWKVVKDCFGNGRGGGDSKACLESV